MGNSQSQDILQLTFALREVSLRKQNEIFLNFNHNNDSNNNNNNVNENKELITEELKFKDLTSINEINLYKNNLIKLYPNIGFLNSTTSLKLCYNNLTEIPPEIGYMKYLKILNISNNKIEKIPDTICYLKRLVDLNVAYNKISKIPSIISKCNKLVYFNLKGNQIDMLPSELGELKKLKYLNISNNPIQYIPIEINRISSLIVLEIDNCPLASLFDECNPAFALSSELKDLIMSRNQKLLLESTEYQNHATLDMLNELKQYKKYDSNTSSLSMICDQNMKDISIFDLDHSLNKNLSCHHCHFFKDIMLNKHLRELETESISLNEEDEDNSTIEESIINDNKVELKIPTLKELAARTIIRNHILMPTHLLHDDLLYYLSSYKTCSFCHGPYFDIYIRRVRILHKNDKDIPFEYRLCRAHFNSNEDHLREMFKIRPITTPKSLKATEKQEKKYKYKDNEVTNNDGLIYTLNNSVVPNSSRSSSSSSSLSSLNVVILKTRKLSLTTSGSGLGTISQHKSNIKHLFNLKSKHHHKNVKETTKITNNTYNPTTSINIRKDPIHYHSYTSGNNITTKDISTPCSSSSSSLSKSVTINELLNMK